MHYSSFLGARSVIAMSCDLTTSSLADMSIADAVRRSDLSIDELTNILGPGNYHHLSRIAGIDHRHVSRVLKGQSSPSFDVATRIADAAGVTLDELRLYIHHVTS